MIPCNLDDSLFTVHENVKICSVGESDESKLQPVLYVREVLVQFYENWQKKTLEPAHARQYKAQPHNFKEATRNCEWLAVTALAHGLFEGRQD